jgi:N-acetylmuramoyl-L-alanine amidase
MTLIFFVAGLPQLACSKESGVEKKSVKKGAAAKNASKEKKTKGHANAKLKVKARKETAPATRSVAVVAPPPKAAADPALVKEMRYWSNPDYTRIAVTLDREVKFESNHLSANRETGAPSRLYIDLSGAKVAPGVKDIPIGDGLLKTARIAQYRPDIVRVVLDMESIKDYKIFTFSDPFRIIIDVKGGHRAEISRLPETGIAPMPPPPPVPPPEPRQTEEKPKSSARPAIAKVRRIVVDPGHGGHDPGAIGAGGVREKDVVLQIGLKLAKELKDDLGLDVVMTRSTDVFLELQERTAIANQVGADLFVSVHANASPNRNTTGIETYYLNLAKTEKAAQLAAKENGTTLEKVSILQAVLFDLMANYKLNDSAHLAEEVQMALYGKINSRHAGARNLGVKQGPFYVLVGATMPSILVEVAFLSNEREERLLQDPQYQNEVATGIMEGIKRYIDSVK